jgi:hypothetical protein
MSKKIFCSGGCSAKLGAGLLSNLIKSGQLETNYSLMVETTKDAECVVANPENEVVKIKKR